MCHKRPDYNSCGMYKSYESRVSLSLQRVKIRIIIDIKANNRKHVPKNLIVRHNKE